MSQSQSAFLVGSTIPLVKLLWAQSGLVDLFSFNFIEGVSNGSTMKLQSDKLGVASHIKVISTYGMTRAAS